MRFGGLGGWEWIIILVIVIILFGGSKLAGVGAALGQSIREFREAVSGSKSGSKEEESKDDASDGAKTS
jgi:sec-independent protein translocase protein TatA